MIPRQRWVVHQFNFDIDSGWTQNIITRIADISIRCDYHGKDLSEKDLSTRFDGNWSIKEHVGHLIDLEDLHIKRLIEFQELKTELSAADMSNKQTESSNHNNSTWKDLIIRLKDERGVLIKKLQEMNEDSLNHQALHPRLKVPMRPVDIAFFVGEHDDHHLTTILEIKKKLLNQ